MDTFPCHNHCTATLVFLYMVVKIDDNFTWIQRMVFSIWYFTRALIHMYAVARLGIIYINSLSEHINASDEVMQSERRIRSSLTWC